MNLSNPIKAVTRHSGKNRRAIVLIPAAMNGIVLLMGPAAVAQIIPDRTLGSEQSTLNQNVTINNQNSDRIEGGARRGNNLFHSFEQFNVNEGQRLYFANPAGVVNIVGRVTGGDRSTISGTLGVDGTANLFLLNPNGIVFGRNATLDVRGSFVATTANRLEFGDQGFFSADNPQAPSLLTVNPSALLFNQITPGRIETQSVADAGSSLAGNPLVGLRVADGQNLLLIGGDLAIAGGLTALGGQLGLVAAQAPATVELSATSRPFIQRLSPASARANVLINGGAPLNVRADQGGEIQINAEDIQIHEGSVLRAGIDRDLGSSDSQAGDIVLDATGDIEVSGSSVFNLLLGTGTGGDLLIRGRSLSLDEGAVLIADTRSQGNAGRIVIRVVDAVVLTESATIYNTISPNASGSTGGILLEAGSLTITDGAELISNTEGTGNVGNTVVRVRGAARLTGVNAVGDPSGIFNVVRPGGVGNAGDIRLSAQSLSLTNGARIQGNTQGQGNAGSVSIRVRDRFLLDSAAASVENFTGIFTAVGTDGVGRGGDINIRAGSLAILNGAQLTANTFERGNAGNITIQVRGSAILDGSNNNYEPTSDRNIVVLSGVFSAVGEEFRDETIPAFGDGGNIRISARQLVLQNGAALGTAVSSDSRGNAGSIIVTATDRVLIDGRSSNRDASSIQTQVSPGAVGNANEIQITTDHLTVSNGGFLQASMGSNGRAGDISINSRLLEVWGGGQLRTTTAGSRPAGNINLRVDDRITLSGQRTGLFANTEQGSTGRGGNINVTTSLLTIQDRATISAAAATATSRGGDVRVTADRIQLNRAGNLSVAAPNGGTAGSLQVTTQQLTVSNRSEITVSSPTGRAGNLAIAANEIALDRGRLTAEAGVGRGAEITLQELDSLLLQNNSLISAQAFADATGGNVTVNAADGFIVAVPEQNSDIIANAVRARGGNIQIAAQGIFNLEEQRSLPANQTNDIDASSQFNQSGVVAIERPDIDPSRGLVTLPTNLVDRSNQIARGCRPRNSESSRFVATGRGGLPLSPDQLLRDRTIVTPDWVTLASEDEQPAGALPSQEQSSLEPASSPEIPYSENLISEYSIVEADGFRRDGNGQIVLVAQLQANAVSEPLGHRACLEQSP